MGIFKNKYFQYGSLVRAIDKKDIHKIKKELKNFDNKQDVVYELYDKKFITAKRLNFINNDCSSFLLN